jgi:DOPA 4,5-dioxygenase
MAKAYRSVEDVKEFHAHVYYGAGSRDAAAALRETLMQMAGGRLTIYTLSDGPRGPHVTPMFGVDIPKTDLPEVLAFLMLNHGGLQVLIHPVTDNEVMDHSHHALWLGERQPINLAVLA